MTMDELYTWGVRDLRRCRARGNVRKFDPIDDLGRSRQFDALEWLEATLERGSALLRRNWFRTTPSCPHALVNVVCIT